MFNETNTTFDEQPEPNQMLTHATRNLNDNSNLDDSELDNPNVSQPNLRQLELIKQRKAKVLQTLTNLQNNKQEVQFSPAKQSPLNKTLDDERLIVLQPETPTKKKTPKKSLFQQKIAKNFENELPSGSDIASQPLSDEPKPKKKFPFLKRKTGLQRYSGKPVKRYVPPSQKLVEEESKKLQIPKKHLSKKSPKVKKSSMPPPKMVPTYHF